MIRSFRHKGLKRLFENDDRSKVSAQDVDKLARILARLNRSRVPEDMAAPGFRLHPLKGIGKASGPSPQGLTGASFSGLRTAPLTTLI